MMLAYFRGRLSNKIHALVLSEFARQEKLGKISKASLSRRVGKKPEQITRWLGSSGNWTIETLSDLLLGMGLEPSISLKVIHEQQPAHSKAEYKIYEKTVYSISSDVSADSLLSIDMNIKDVVFNSNINQKHAFEISDKKILGKKTDNFFFVSTTAEHEHGDQK
ncbi:MAG TPA: hypothetical protein VK958_08535 [Methylophilus sp.]|uniref:hypothetical protein n=1 Tax=Methylophilus sp. TaxID=29541 RepID=UPI002CE45361|nr:hypothetical protein [Methylophilus sp.]HSH87277.1 hypothetical protein [Methylophilus sp.]